jgi:carboxyl-terminal processing protease
MKIKVGLSLILGSFFLHSCASVPAIKDTGRLKPLPEHEEVSKALTRVIETSDYKKPVLNDSLSGVIFDRYLKDLDNNKSYFIKSDIDEFIPYRTQTGKFLESGDMSVPFTLYNRLYDRQKERFDYVYRILNDSLKTNTNQNFEVNREKADWFATKQDLNNYWKKKIEYELISLDMAQKDHTKNIATLLKRYQTLQKQIEKSKSEDVFLVFMNSFASSVDPHTTYFSPNRKQDFNIEMSKSLEGIGATLQSENDYIKIAALTKGGPAEKSKLISPNDRIVAVAQGKTGEFVDIIGWRTDDAVQLIRGPKGTTVRLKILAANTSTTSLPKIIELVRDKINLVDQRATSSVENFSRNGKTYKIGVINLGDFYLDFEAAQRGDKNYNSTSRDVHRILDSLKKVGVDGVVLDLRNNGGGSLKEAIDLTGLFIKQGPVVQVKDMNGRVEVDADRNPEQVYDGPLAVLVNTFSASASEIFAGAIQDYGRGIIIGESTYGKGTVQSAVSINDILPGVNKPLGQLNLTIAKFYRINGSSTQLRGVTPDILFPNKIPREKFGEESEPSALPWDQIESSNYMVAGNVGPVRSFLRNAHDRRMESSPYFKEWLEDVNDLKITLEKSNVVLNQKDLEAEHLQEEKREFEKYNVLRKLSGLEPLPPDSISADTRTLSGNKPGPKKPNIASSRVPIDPELLIKKDSFQVIADWVDDLKTLTRNSPEAKKF